MSALFLTDLAAKTHRGQRGRVEAGKAGGSLGYGYDLVKALDAAGEPFRGERRINETQAEIVRRIIREFAAGSTPRAIARRLNYDGNRLNRKRRAPGAGDRKELAAIEKKIVAIEDGGYETGDTPRREELRDGGVESHEQPGQPRPRGPGRNYC